VLFGAFQARDSKANLLPGHSSVQEVSDSRKAVKGVEVGNYLLYQDEKVFSLDAHSLLTRLILAL
jgi:hypothetical protein